MLHSDLVRSGSGFKNPRRDVSCISIYYVLIYDLINKIYIYIYIFRNSSGSEIVPGGE